MADLYSYDELMWIERNQDVLKELMTFKGYLVDSYNAQLGLIHEQQQALREIEQRIIERRDKVALEMVNEERPTYGTGE